MSAHLRAQAAGNLTVSAYCATRDLIVATFYYWRKKLGRPAAEKPEPKGFTELKPVAEPQRSRLRLPSGLCVELRGLSTPQLTDLLLALDCWYA